MNRDEKALKIGELHETFSRAQFAVVADYRGLKVTELEKLRRNLRGTSGEVKIAKNTLLKLAVKDTDYEALASDFSGTTAVALSFADPVLSAKAVTEFAKEFQALKIRSASLDGKLLSAEDVVALSKLPGKDELRAQLLGVFLAVPTGFVRVLNGVPQKLVYALQAIKDQKEN